MIRRFRSKLRKHFREVLKIKKSPHSIAMGFAIGTFLAIMPTPGFSILLGFLVILIFEKVNKFSLLGAMAFWNPITLIPIYYISYHIGNIFIGDAPIVVYRFVLLNQLFRFTRRFLIGNLILAVFFSITFYFLVRFLAKKYQEYKELED